MRSASKKYLQILMTKEAPVEIGCQTEQTTLGTSYADRGCQTDSGDQVDTSRIDGSIQTESGSQVKTTTSCADGGCQTESVGQVDTECQTEVLLLLPGSEHAQILACEVIMPRIVETSSNGIFSLLSKDFRQHQFLKLTKPRNSKGDRSNAIKKIAKKLKAAGALMCIDQEDELRVIEKLVASYDKIILDKSDDGRIILDKSDNKISIDQLIAIRDEMQTSTNGVSRLVAAIKKFQPKLASFFPTRVKHNIAKQEREKREESGTQADQLGSTD
jgi:hypothetical protein